MYLYLARDDNFKAKNKWYVGVTGKKECRKIKQELKLDPKTGAVDFVVEAAEPKHILRRFRKALGYKRDRNSLLIVEGKHCELAQLLIQITQDYEMENPSLSRSLYRWFTSVDS